MTTATTKTAACAACGHNDELRAIYPVDESQNIVVEIDEAGTVSYEYNGSTDTMDGIGDDEGFSCGNCGAYTETIEALLGLPPAEHVPTAAETHLAEMRDLAERIASLVSGTSYHVPAGDLAEMGVSLAELVCHYDPKAA